MDAFIRPCHGTLSEWLEYDPILAKGEVALVATDDTKPDEYNSKKVGDGVRKFSQLPMLGYECLQTSGDSTLFPMSQDVVSRQLRQASRQFFLDRDHLIDMPSDGTANYTKATQSNKWSCLTIQLNPNATRVNVSGGTVWKSYYLFFSSQELSNDSYIGVTTNGKILPGAKFCAVNLEHSENAQNYDGIVVEQFTDLTDIVTDEADRIPSNRAVMTALRQASVGNFFLDRDHLILFSSEGHTYTASPEWDLIVVPLNPNATRLEVEGIAVFNGNFIFYDSAELTEEHYISNRSDATVPAGAKFCAINTKKIENADNDYAHITVRQHVDLTVEITDEADRIPSNRAVSPLRKSLADVSINEITGIEVLGKYLASADEGIVKNEGMAYYVFPAEGECEYEISGAKGKAGVDFNAINITDADDNLIKSVDSLLTKGQTLHPVRIRTPKTGGYLRLVVNSRPTDEIRVKKIATSKDFLQINETIEAYNRSLRSMTAIGIDVGFTEGRFGSIQNNKLIFKKHASTKYAELTDIDPKRKYRVRGIDWPSSGWDYEGVLYTDAENGVIGCELSIKGPYKLTEPYVLTIPEGTKKIIINGHIGSDIKIDSPAYGSVPDYRVLIEKDRREREQKRMKVHVYGMTTPLGSNLFHIRTGYNAKNDIILLYYTNDNSLISPWGAYIGDKTLQDSVLMTSPYRVSLHSDSTAPFFNADVYWHLFAQHGCPMPMIDNTNGMTSDDIGSIWKDQLDRQYIVGNVTPGKITLLTPFENKGDWNDRKWRNTVYSTAIASLTHVSGGVTTAPVSAVEGYTQTQLSPVMATLNRRWLADGKEITEAGDYYCDEFQVSESQVGYDPSAIINWFPTPSLAGVPEMARFTWSYNFFGAQCCVNTTVNVLRKIEAQSYGACQQQFFHDTGEYKAMFVIPKVKPQNGVTLDKPFNSPTTSSPTFGFWRNADCLWDVNDPYDRQIGFLHNPLTGDYLVGMAAGLSLVSGDTVREKRISNIQVDTDNDAHNRLGSFSPSNTNKFYIAAVNSYPFKEYGYLFPVNYFKEINYYVSYFDPAENKGQVYWYKDGKRFVIYAHCQQEARNAGINLPQFMEGLGVRIVEKTGNTELLTNRIASGKLYVNWNSDDSNYIVLETE